jgi:hypothetical protein
MNSKLLRVLDTASPATPENGSQKQALLAYFLIVLTVFVTATTAFALRKLSAEQKTVLQKQFRVTLQKRKGPFGQNVCVCSDRRKELVLRPDGTIQNVCGEKTQFCSAFRAPWAEALGQQGVYIGNLLSNDLYLWDRFPDPHDLVRGHILEKYFIETHPGHRLAVAKTLRGVSGAEYEAPAVPRFAERYLSQDSFRDARHFLLAYELQKRFFVGEDQGRITKIRNMATQVESRDPKFKPLRDATHNQISASLIPRLSAYRDRLPNGQTRARLDALITEIDKLTSLDKSALRPQLGQVEDAALRTQLQAAMPPQDAEPLEVITSLADMMVLARKEVAKRSMSPADARRLIDLNVTAAAVLQSRGSAFLERAEPQTVKQYVRLLIALTEASYGVGLLTERERQAATDNLAAVLDAPKVSRVAFTRKLDQAGRIVGWAQEGALLAFAEVWEAWTLLLPEVALIGDDILRGSPLLLFGQAITRLEDHALGQERARHQVMGEEFTAHVRALNPGLAMGKLHVSPKDGTYSRDEVLALDQTPSELQPVAGIVTQGEGNVLSHVQLLARALGIPNVVTGSEPFTRIARHDGKEVFFVVTPGGRVYLKEAANMTEQDRAIYADFNRNTNRASDGSLGAEATKLDIDPASLDLSVKTPLGLSEMSIRDSGVRSGPKAAYLGELKRLFPNNVSRGVVLPFGVYYAHYQQAKVAVPENLQDTTIAEVGKPLPDFVERTYQTFFGDMIPGGASEKDLRAWIEPRLTVIRASITESPLSAELTKAIQQALDQQGLLRSEDKSQTVGCFVRSDTNVEDLENFNGAGLNLTLFNLRSLQDIYDGIKEVWASPFTFRSFSWRQPLIDEPLWVLPSIVILESVPSEKSGVLVTADIVQGDPGKMVVATSEGVGGAVDGTPAETLVWSPQTVELVNAYKSPWRLMLTPDGGSEVVPSTGQEYVLSKDELDKVIAVAIEINEKLEPSRDASGTPRPWDIEFGFANGQLWLFQTRPFVGNEELRNLSALASLDVTTAPQRQFIALDEVISGNP